MRRHCLDCGKLARGSRCVDCQRMHSRRRGATGWDRDRVNRGILERDMGMCRRCAGAASVVDHIVPLSRGGADTAANKQSLCGACHAAKTRSESRGQR